MKIEIKHRYTGSVLFSHEAEENSLKITLEMAVKARANPTDAYLAGAYLVDANLAGAYLDGANLAGAYLDGANLAGAYLDGAYLTGAKIEDEIITLQPIQISGLTWSVLITDGYLRIGCQRHTHERWFEFSDELIARE